MKKYRSWIIGVLVIALVCVVVVVAKNGKKASSDKDVSVGLILPMTDFLKSYGEAGLKGAEAALAETEGVKIVVEDDACDAKKALSAFQKLTAVDRVDVIIGPICGSPQEALAPVANTAGIPILLPSAASESLFEASGSTMFNIQYSLENEGKALAEKMYADGHRRVVVVTYKNAFSESETRGFLEAYKGDVVRHLVFAENSADIRTELAKLKGVEFDAVFSSEISFFFSKGVDTMSQYGFSRPVYSPYPVEDPSARPLAEGVIYSFPGGIIGNQGATYGLAYDALKKAAQAAKGCGKNKACILKNLQSDGAFDAQGTSTRPLMFKRIVRGEPVII